MSDTILEFCEGCNAQIDFLPNAGEKKLCDDCKCVYCGESKWENKNKHLNEFFNFLNEKVEEMKEIFKI